MQFDTTKLPEWEWLTFSEAVTYLAFGEAFHKEALVQAGFPSDQTFRTDIEQALERCREEAQANPRYSALIQLGNETHWSLADISSTRLLECKSSWPSSGADLHELVEEWERARGEEDHKLAEAAEAIRAAGGKGRLKFRGARYGRPDADPEIIDADAIRSSQPLKWTTETVKASPSRQWDDVRIERASLVQWLDSQNVSCPGAGTTAPDEARPKQKPGAKDAYDWPLIEKTVRKALAPVGGRLKTEGAASQAAMIRKVREWHETHWPKKPAPAPTTLKRKFEEWRLHPE